MFLNWLPGTKRRIGDQNSSDLLVYPGTPRKKTDVYKQIIYSSFIYTFIWQANRRDIRTVPWSINSIGTVTLS